MITAIVTAFERIEQTLATLKVIQSCDPRPAEILVHVDDNRQQCAQAVTDAFPALNATLAAGRAVVLVAPPGAGKTTLVPLELLSAQWREDGKILMLEPRRLAR